MGSNYFEFKSVNKGGAVVKIRIRKRRDNPLVRRRFAVLCGTGATADGVHEITRIFFPWFYVDFLFSKPKKT
jgi:hypothetical protein